MKLVKAKITDRMDRALEELVERGWFESREAAAREAIRRFLKAHQAELIEGQVGQDVDWGLRGRS